MIDTFKHKGNRKKLVDLLSSKGINDKNVLEAINKVPRHLFIDSAFEEHAYEDKAFPISANQTISQPFTVAFQTQLLESKPKEKILEIGTGSGYQTAVLISMNTQVWTIERQKELFDFSKKILNQLHLYPRHQSFGDGYQGFPSFAPFDKIIVTAGTSKIPYELLRQLKIGGLAVIPIGDNSQIMTTFKRISESEFEQKHHGEFQFVPMLEKSTK